MAVEIYGHKHMIQCSCTVHGLSEHVFYQFPVFSLCGTNEKNENAFIDKYICCPNCGALHHVINYCQSIIVSRNDNVTPVTVDDVRISIPANICLILESYDADLATWEEIKHIITSGISDASVILKISTDLNLVHGKKLIFSKGNISLESFSEQLYIE